MHLQIRSEPALSPPSLAAFLAVLVGQDINIESAGGHDIEAGGEFVFSVAHDDHERALEVLRNAGYNPREVEVADTTLDDSTGQLLEFVMEVTEQNALTGRVIRDITVGVPNADGRIQVQIYSDLP